MSPLAISLISACSIFAGALLGLGLQRLLPSHHLSKEMQDLVKLSAGTIATLTALVLGLLVSSAKGSFDTIGSEIVQGSAKFVLLDRTLARYGPETSGARAALKAGLAAGLATGWTAGNRGVPTGTTLEHARGIEGVQDQLRQLTPQDDAQRQVLAQAQQLASELLQSRWMVIEEAHTQLPLPLLLILVFWLALLFVSFGLFAPRNAMALAVLFVGSCAVSAAIFLALELNQPLDGIIKVSSAPLQNALRHLGE